MIADIPDHKFVVMKKYPESIFNSDEVHTFSLRLSEVIALHLGDVEFILTVLPLLKKSTSDLSNTLGRTTDSTNVDLLLVKDTIRDSAFVGLRDLAKAFSNNSDPVLASAGKILTDIIQELGWGMHRLGYVIESSKLNTLIDRFEKEPAKGALASIGALNWFDTLKTAQTDFENIYKEKVNSIVAEDYRKTRECRSAITRYIKALLSYVDIMAEVNGGKFNDTATKINEVIAEITSIARSRQTRKEEEAKKNTEAGK